MSLPVEEVDNDGRAIFFKCPADISKSVAYDNHEICTQERVNSLYEARRLPSPKFRGFVYNYSPFLTLCSRGQNGRHKVKQKIDYRNIKAAYPCERDPSVVFMIVDGAKSRGQMRVFRLPSAIMATKFRYVIDQLQLNPVHESGRLMAGSIRTTVNSGSSFSTPITEESDNSVTSAAHCYQRSAAYGPTMRSFYDTEEEPKLPRVQPFAFGPLERNPLYQSNRSLARHKSDIFENFDASDYEIHRPSRPTSRMSRGEDAEFDYNIYDPRRSMRRRPSRMDAPPSRNFNSRSIGRNSMRQKNPIYLEPEYPSPYDYDQGRRTGMSRVSRNGSVPRRYDFY